MLKVIEEFQNQAPEGCLKYQNRDNSTYFYHQYRNEQTKKWERRYIKKEDGSYEQATGYDYNEQYYRNMNSLLALLRAWQDIVKDTQADWTYDVGHVEWNQNNPLHPRFIRNKPVVLTVDLTAEDESSINWYWKNYAL